MHVLDFNRAADTQMAAEQISWLHELSPVSHFVSKKMAITPPGK